MPCPYTKYDLIRNDTMKWSYSKWYHPVAILEMISCDSHTGIQGGSHYPSINISISFSSCLSLNFSTLLFIMVGQCIDLFSAGQIIAVFLSINLRRGNIWPFTRNSKKKKKRKGEISENHQVCQFWEVQWCKRLFCLLCEIKSYCRF